MRVDDANSELDTEGRVRELMKATLILANGSVFSGTSIGSTSDRVCEMVFNTSMTGYQEILTDPSYAGQGSRDVLSPHRQLRRQP